ncbi:SET family protein [Acanthamoeba castellanii str. Neff]|uniref:SET family protein n=1 Tax=Acanthamoeba castellanii (strain ATCC 30010 / Neff) TaxID=1257118 RepID=L8HHE2_ACACF|nr:SET family protein [Acanthamoeba castellanii str. Neff]ELR24098.1 SET family protein [Acanthamoeba castellanii str. Neff]
MPLSPKVRVSTEGAIHGNGTALDKEVAGRGWFAAEDIKEGEVIWFMESWLEDKDSQPGIFVNMETIKSWPQEKQDQFWELGYQCGDDLFHGFPSDVELDEEGKKAIQENYVNHTCDGNAWYISDNELVALRDIKKGEEIAYDYALTECHEAFRLNCRCGTSKCRGTVTGDDWKLPELQQRYGRHFLPHILAKIDAAQPQPAQ